MISKDYVKLAEKELEGNILYEALSPDIQMHYKYGYVTNRLGQWLADEVATNFKK